MYKCKDCGQEYVEKPQYCDCGNNEFDVLLESASTLINQSDEKHSIISLDKSKDMNKYEIISWLIFLVCIVLSVLSFIFIGGYKLQESDKNILQDDKKHLSSKNVNKQIPSINELWEVSSPKTFSTQNQSKNENSKNLQKEDDKNLKKQVNYKKPIEDKPKKAKVQSNNVGLSKNTVQKTTNEKKVISKSVKSRETAEDKQELYQYKIALRNKFASNINFAGVSGDGYCVVTFKISSKGEIVNRSFSKLSKNDSLNDMVYAGVMKTPYFNPPPKAYKNEALNLHVKMYGGNFEVALN